MGIEDGNRKEGTMLKRLACGFLLLAGGLLSSGCCMSRHGVCDAGVGCDSCGDAASATKPAANANRVCATIPGCGPMRKRADLRCRLRGRVLRRVDERPAGLRRSLRQLRRGQLRRMRRVLESLARIGTPVGLPLRSGWLRHRLDVGYDEGCDSCAESYETVMPGEMPVEESRRRRRRSKRSCLLRNRTRNRRPPKQASAKRSGKTVKVVPASHKTTDRSAGNSVATPPACRWDGLGNPSCQASDGRIERVVSV